jgi:iron complex outermembrane recepter protein
MGMRSTLLGSVAVCTAAIAATPAAIAQSTTPPAGPPANESPTATPAPVAVPAEDLQSVTVTASRLSSLGFSAPTPTSVLSSDALESRGLTNVGDALNEMPSFRPSQNAATAPQSSSQSGQTYADLRGLGSTRTLVLVDGRRFVPSAPTGQVDLNLIPTILIDRVEVVTGGASASYGSDAVSGVVNIILNKKLEGLKTDFSTGISTYGDDLERRFSLAYGSGFAGDRGHFVIGGEYVQSDGVDSYLDRPWGRRADDVISFPTNRPAGTPSRIFASGATYTNSPSGGIIIGPNADTNPANGADVLRGIGFGPGGTPYNFNYGNDPGGGTAYNNTAPDGSFTRLGQEAVLPVTRYTVVPHLDFNITDHLSFFVEGNYARSGSTYNGPTLRDTSTTAIVLKQDNAFLPDSVRATMAANNIATFSLARANVDYDQSLPDNYNITRRVVAGLKGDLGGSWTWDGYYEYGRDTYEQDLGNVRITRNFNYAIDAVRDPGTGQIVCRALLPGSSTYNPTAAAGCQPLDLFGNGSPSQAASDYVHGTSFYQIVMEQQAGALNLRGEPFNTWAGPFALAAGAEYRKDQTEATADPLSQAGLFAFGNPKAFSGSFNTKEVYSEVDVPLARNLPALTSFDLNGAVRYTDYSSSGDVTTWKVGAVWKPIDNDITFRATRSRDIRAPNASELFQITGSTSTLRNTFSGQTLQINLVNEPSPTLQPEKADTTTVGFVLEPRFVPGLHVSVDYYNIDIRGAISSYAPQSLIDNCYAEVQAGAPGYFCSFVTRNGTGTTTNISSVAVQLVNIAAVKASGVDFDILYRHPLGVGSLTTQLLGTYTAHLTSDDGLGNAPSFNSAGVIQSLGSVIDHAGQVGGFFSGNNNGATGAPHWQLNGSLGYALERLTTTLQERYVGGGKVDKTLVDPSSPYYNPASPISVLNNDVTGRFYTNVSASYKFIDDERRKLELYGVVNNLFDVAPPFPATQVVGFYDRVGRYFTVGFRLSL